MRKLIIAATVATLFVGAACERRDEGIGGSGLETGEPTGSPTRVDSPSPENPRDQPVGVPEPRSEGDGVDVEAADPQLEDAMEREADRKVDEIMTGSRGGLVP